MISIQMPEAAENIINALELHGFEAYVVGGCVRDSILGRNVNDWDITTSANPEDVKQIFRRTIDTGIQHGTVTIMDGTVGYEVTTYRIDGKYSDGRHPEQVTFTASLEEDLKRRDFTINAMAYHPTRGIVDLYGGMEDLKSSVIRCVGNPEERFGEDALRILRAVRFSAQLGFAIEENTLEAIQKLAPTLEKISHERIREELNKLLMSDHPEDFRILEDTGITKVILPEFHELTGIHQQNAYHYLNAADHTLEVMKHSPKNRYLRWAALLHDIAKSKTLTVDPDGTTHFYGHPEVGAGMARRILTDLRWDNDTIAIVSRLVRYHDYRCPRDRMHIRRMMNRVGTDIFPMVLDLMRADTYGKRKETWDRSLAEIAEVEAIYHEILSAEECTCLKDLAIDGRSLIRLGIPAGPNLGKILNQLLDEVLEDSSRNTEEYLSQRALTLWKALQ